MTWSDNEDSPSDLGMLENPERSGTERNETGSN